MNKGEGTMAQRVVDLDALQSRFAMRLTARLGEQAEAVSHDVGERLRVARECALERARAHRAAMASPALQTGNAGAATLALGGGSWSSSSWWVRFVQVLPLLALMAGLLLIQNQHVRAQISAAAEIDFDLLVDELPPAAYGDPGFVEFLKARND
jgi:Protein of unknown function (DUF3619)